MSEVREQRRAVHADWWEVGLRKLNWRVDSAILSSSRLTIEERVKGVGAPWHVNFTLTKFTTKSWTYG